jgi:hypothetical protein
MDDDETEEEDTSQTQSSYRKKVEEGDEYEPTIIKNIDSRNAVQLRFIEGLGERVEVLAKSIQDDLDQESDTPLDIPLGSVGIGLFELHAVTIAFVEASGWILTTWMMDVEEPRADTLITYYSEHDRYDFLEGNKTEEEKFSAIRKHLRDGSSAYQYQQIFSQMGIIEDELNDVIHDVRMSRNDYIHNPIEFMNITDVDEVLSVISNCIRISKSVEDVMERELPVDNAFYDIF